MARLVLVGLSVLSKNLEGKVQSLSDVSYTAKPCHSIQRPIEKSNERPFQ